MTLVDLKRELTDTSIQQVIKNVCGKRIGRGVYRDVYEIKGMPGYVIKVQRRRKEADFTNACEWTNYINHCEWKQLGPWLAPCYMINHAGTVLVQQKIEFRSHDQYPDKIPSVFTDTKYQNYGWIGDQFVCCDYPFLKLVGFGMRVARWWDENGEKKK